MQSIVTFAPERVIMRAWEQEMREAEASNYECRRRRRRRSRVLRREPAELGERTVSEGQGPVYMGAPCYPALSCAMMESLAWYRGSEVETRIVWHLQMLVETGGAGIRTATEWCHSVMTLVDFIRQQAAVEFHWFPLPVDGDTGYRTRYSAGDLILHCWNSIQQASDLGRCSNCHARTGESCIVETWIQAERIEGESNLDLSQWTHAQLEAWRGLAATVMLTAIGSVWNNEIMLSLCSELIEQGEMFLTVDEGSEDEVVDGLATPPPLYTE